MFEREIRTTEARLELRAAEEARARLAGYAALFGRVSDDLGGFREVIEPGFFDQALGDDVRATWQHDSNFIFGRTRAGTLRLGVDAEGLTAEIDPPDAQWARDALVSIGRGDVDQMSFAFAVREGGDRWEERDGYYLRRLLPGGCARLYDVAVVTYPAYPQTQVSKRALDGLAGLRAQLPPDDTTDKAGEKWARARLQLRRRDLQLTEIMGGIKNHE